MVLKKLGGAIRKTPKAVVTRGTGRTLARQPKPFSRKVRGNGMPTSSEIFNVGKITDIPTGDITEIGTSRREGTRILKRSGKRRTRIG